MRAGPGLCPKTPELYYGDKLYKLGIGVYAHGHSTNVSHEEMLYEWLKTPALLVRSSTINALDTSWQRPEGEDKRRVGSHGCFQNVGGALLLKG